MELMKKTSSVRAIKPSFLREINSVSDYLLKDSRKIYAKGINALTTMSKLVELAICD